MNQVQLITLLGERLASHPNHEDCVLHLCLFGGRVDFRIPRHCGKNHPVFGSVSIHQQKNGLSPEQWTLLTNRIIIILKEYPECLEHLKHLQSPNNNS